MRKIAIIMAVLALAGSGARVQGDPVKLAERTPVRVALLETLTSGQGKPNDEVGFELREDLYGPNRELLAVKGSPAFGHIIRSKKRGMFGRSGKLDFSCDYVKAIDGTKVALRGTQTNSGKGNGTAAVATALVVNVLGVLINGRDVSVAKGTEFTVYVDKDTMIDPANAVAAAGTAAAVPAQTYTIALKSQLMQTVAKELTGQAKLSSASFAISQFELIPEKEGTRIDGMVARNAREDLSTALSSVHGIKLVDSAEWDKTAAALGVDGTKSPDADIIKSAGATVKATHVIVGSISDRGAIVVVNARLVSTATGDTVCSASAESGK